MTYIREPKLTPTPNARRVSDIPIEELYLGFEVRSLMTGAPGFVIEYETDTGYGRSFIFILWKNGNISVQEPCNLDCVEEIL